MIAQSSLAAVVAAAGIALTSTPASAAGTGVADGCVSRAEYAQLGLGQTLVHVGSVAGKDAMVSRRAWSTGDMDYKERRYTMCTPTDSAHATLTTRFMWYDGAWRAFIVDTLLGPEK